MSFENIKEEFPIFKTFMEDKELNETRRPLIYFDNGATSQTPRDVINAMNDFYCRYKANIHRSPHGLGQKATQMYEDAHKDMAKFLNADSDNEIIFTKNITEAMNLVAYCVARSMLKDGGEVLTTETEHHSNLVPWQVKNEASFMPKGVKLDYLKVYKDGSIDLDKAKEKITKKTKMVSIVHISNFFGAINPVKEIAKLAHENGAWIMVDSAQAVPHMPINVKDLDVDFLGFTAHKMLGPFGIGGLYGKEDILKKLPPFLRGGDMVDHVDRDHATWKPGKIGDRLTMKFEAGTAPVAEAVGLSEAIKYIERKGGMKNIRDHERQLVEHTIRGLQEIPPEKITIYGPTDVNKRGGLVSFILNDVPHLELATELWEFYKIAVRNGYHCAEPAHKLCNSTGSVRASYHIYNDEGEIDKLLRILSNRAEGKVLLPEEV
jgi:cysteine desulfurase/selenocysteine lyase